LKSGELVEEAEKAAKIVKVIMEKLQKHMS
jgi:hypothetical protein